GITKGRHYFDLFHLESRMGNWHSMLTLETDPETEEFIFTNCRKMIDYIQTPPTDEKIEYRLYKEIINNYWPVLLKFGINSLVSVKENDQENDDDLETSSIGNILVKAINKIELIEENGSLLVKPDVQLTNIYDSYSFSIEKFAEPITVKLTSFYRNQKAKNKINIILKKSDSIEVYDILDLN